MCLDCLFTIVLTRFMEHIGIEGYVNWSRQSIEKHELLVAMTMRKIKWKKEKTINTQTQISMHKKKFNFVEYEM